MDHVTLAWPLSPFFGLGIMGIPVASMEGWVLQCAREACLGIGQGDRPINQRWKKDVLHASRSGVKPLQIGQVWPDLFQIPLYWGTTVEQDIDALQVLF